MQMTTDTRQQSWWCTRSTTLTTGYSAALSLHSTEGYMLSLKKVGLTVLKCGLIVKNNIRYDGCLLYYYFLTVNRQYIIFSKLTLMALATAAYIMQ